MRRVNRAFRATLFAVFISLSPPALSSGVGAAEALDNVVEIFDVARDGDLLLVPVTLGNQQFQFVVDTGASFSLIDSALESYLDLLPGSAQVNGNRREKRYHLRAAFVGKSRQLLQGKAICLDLTQIREASGYNIRGIIGMDFLRARVVQIDFDAGKLSILKELPPSVGREFRLFYNKFEVPALNIELADGDSVAFVVDTGMLSDTSLRNYRIDDLLENGRLQLIGPPVLGTTVDGEVRHRIGRLDKFRIGNFRHEQINVSEGERNQIGLGLLSQYLVTFDFPNDGLYLKPGTRFARPEKSDRSGLTLRRIDGKLRIKGVADDSAAASAGLSAGDEVLQIDEKDASSLSIFAANSILATSGARVRLDVEGLAGRRRVEIRLSTSGKAKGHKKGHP